MIIAAWSPQDFFQLRWRLQIWSHGTSVTPIRFELLRDRDPDRFGESPAGGLTDSDPRINFLCYRTDGRRRGIPVIAGIPFANHPRLNIQLLDPQSKLSKESRDRTGRAIIEAAEVWRRACTECLPDNLALVRIDDTLYALRVLMDGLKNLPASTLPSAAPNVFQFPPGPFSFVSLMTARAGTRTPVDSYVPISEADIAYKNLCSAPASGLPDVLLRIRAVAECKNDTVPSAKPLSLGLLLVDGPTSCGTDRNIIACEADDELMELNTSVYAFSGQNETNIFRAPAPIRTVDLLHVILHEFGHWVGLGHLPTPGNLMATSMEDSLCIDNTVVAELEKATRSQLTETRLPKAFYYQK
jgi:hypothetical protein